MRDKGNTILVVEHDPDVIAIADHIVDMGPNAGNKGGEIVYEGNLEGLSSAGTLTGKFWKRTKKIKANLRLANDYIKIENAQLHNLKK